MVSLFVEGPDTTLVHVASINTGSALDRYAKELKEEVEVLLSKLQLLTYLIQVSTRIGRYHYNLTVLPHFNPGVVITTD
jgi:hypothetical protein